MVEVHYGDLISTSRLEEPDCHIFIHSGLSSTITGSFASPGPYGLSWPLTMDHNGNLITAQVDVIFFLSGVSDVITGSISPTYAVGLIVDNNGNLIRSNASTDYIYIHDGLTATVTGSFASPKGLNPAGLAVDSDNNLIQIENSNDYIYIHEGITAVLTGSFASPASTPRDLTMDADGNLISCDANTDFIYIHDGVSSTLTGSFAFTPANEATGVALYLYEEAPPEVAAGLQFQSDGLNYVTQPI